MSEPLGRRRTWLGIGAALATIAVLATAALDASGGSARHVRTMHFLLAEQQQVLDRAPAGPSNGDLVLLRGQLLNPKTRAPVGAEIGMYVMADAQHQNRSIATTVFTPNARTNLAQADQLTIETIFDSVAQPARQVGAITGGTGRFLGSRGEVVATPRADGLLNVVVRLAD
jgi:hypothetical protein